MRGNTRHVGPDLTVDEIGALPEGTQVAVTWNGGNGPWRYRIAHNRGVVCVDTPGHDELLLWPGPISRARVTRLVGASSPSSEGPDPRP